MLNLINTYNTNKFFSAIGHLYELEQRISEWQQIKLVNKEEIERDLFSIQRTISDFQDLYYDYNIIYSEQVRLPFLVDEWFQGFRKELLKLRNSTSSSIIELKTEDLNYLKKFNNQLKQINIVSENIFDYDFGVPDSTKEKISKKGFLNDLSWRKWIQEVESIILSTNSTN